MKLGGAPAIPLMIVAAAGAWLVYSSRPAVLLFSSAGCPAASYVVTPAKMDGRAAEWRDVQREVAGEG